MSNDSAPTVPSNPTNPKTAQSLPRPIDTDDFLDRFQFVGALDSSFPVSSEACISNNNQNYLTVVNNAILAAACGVFSGFTVNDLRDILDRAGKTTTKANESIVEVTEIKIQIAVDNENNEDDDNDDYDGDYDDYDNDGDYCADNDAATNNPPPPNRSESRPETYSGSTSKRSSSFDNGPAL